MARVCLALALLLYAATGLQAQGIYPGNAVRVNDETVSYQRFHGFYIEYRNTKGVAVGARGDQLELLTQLRREAMDLLIILTYAGLCIAIFKIFRYWRIALSDIPVRA